MFKKVFIYIALLASFLLPFGAYALNFQELVKGSVVYAPVTLTSSWNQSLKVTVTAKDYSNGKWNYILEWHRALKTKQGSVYISPKNDSNNKVLKIDSANPDTTTQVALDPATRYRVEFYVNENGKGPLLLRKFFNTLEAPYEAKVCADDVKICADGTFVSRQAPSCEFKACTAVATSTPVVACTLEARMCPDGKTFVSRTGTKCEFAACPATTTVDAFIKVLSPNGGESWQPGNDTTITWQASSNIQNVKIELLKETTCDTVKNCSFEPALTIATSTPNTGNFKWTVQAPPVNTTVGVGAIVRGNYKIRISDSAGHNDSSDSSFFIGIIACTQVMCAAPPEGMCYKPNPTNICGCGELAACSGSDR